MKKKEFPNGFFRFFAFSSLVSAFIFGIQILAPRNLLAQNTSDLGLVCISSGTDYACNDGLLYRPGVSNEWVPYSQAQALCQSQGDGWRLPLLREMMVLTRTPYRPVSVVPGFSSISSEYIDNYPTCNWYYDSYAGYVGYTCTSGYSVGCVKGDFSLPQISTAPASSSCVTDMDLKSYAYFFLFCFIVLLVGFAFKLGAS